MTEQANTGGQMARVKRLEAERNDPRPPAWRADNPRPTPTTKG